MYDSNYSLSDIAAATGKGNNNDGFGNGQGSWWVIIFLIFAFMGWGRNGFDGNNNGSGNGGGNVTYIPYNAGGIGGGSSYTDATIQRGFDNQSVMNKLNGLENGLCDGFYGVNTSILNLGQSLLNCCCDVKTGIMQNGYETRDAINMNSNAIQGQLCQGFNGVERGFCNLSSQLANCCCENREAIAQVRYDMATQACDTRNTIQNATRDILESNNSNTRAILDFLTQDKISTLQNENQALKFQASQTAQNAFITANQSAQTAELIRRLGADCPVNAVVVQPNTPVTFPTNCCGNFSGFNNNNCGCNSGCNCGNY